MRRPNGSDDHQTSATVAMWIKCGTSARASTFSDAACLATTIYTAGPAGIGRWEVADLFGVDITAVEWRLSSDNELDQWRRKQDEDRARADGWCMGLFAERF